MTIAKNGLRLCSSAAGSTSAKAVGAMSSTDNAAGSAPVRNAASIEICVGENRYLSPTQEPSGNEAALMAPSKQAQTKYVIR
jgi:hypothetical protein